MSIYYHVYANDGAGGPIDYSAPVATVAGTTWQSAGLGPGDWSFAVRAVGDFGEEQNVDVVADLAISADGRDATNTPPPPVALLAVPKAGGSMVIHWGYPAGSPASYPTGFHAYKGTGGSVDYSAPAATVSAAWTGAAMHYSATLSGLAGGIAYSFGVRAFNASGEEANTRAVTATARTSGPSAVVSLSVQATR